MTDIKVTVGELGFAVGLVATLRRGFELVKDELGLTDGATQTVLSVSGQSLIAHELATLADKRIELSPPLRQAAEIVAGAEWAVRCARNLGERTQHLTVHIAPTGLLAQDVQADVALRLSVLPTVAAMLDRIAAFFELPPCDGPLTRVSRAAMDELGKLPPGASLVGALAAHGLPTAEAAGLASDINASRWKGTISRIARPKGQEPSLRLAVAVVCGSHTWMIDTRNPDYALVSRASRRNLGESVKGILRDLDSTARKFDRAGEL